MAKQPTVTGIIGRSAFRLTLLKFAMQALKKDKSLGESLATTFVVSSVEAVYLRGVAADLVKVGMEEAAAREKLATLNLALTVAFSVGWSSRKQIGKLAMPVLDAIPDCFDEHEQIRNGFEKTMDMLINGLEKLPGMKSDIPVRMIDYDSNEDGVYTAANGQQYVNRDMFVEPYPEPSN